MLPSARLEEIARTAVFKHLREDSVEQVSSEETFDSEGRDAVRITITLKPKAAARLEDDAVLDALVEIRTDLYAAGEERTPIVEYAEVGELVEADDVDPQP